MKKKKLKLKPKKQTLHKLRRDNRVLFAVIGVFFATGLVLGLISGVLIVLARPHNQHPTNVVIAADTKTNVPDDLIAFLKQQRPCPKGVGLFSVYQVSRGKFAKMSHGCSTNVENYIMAVKISGHWQLIPTTEYFMTNGFLPKCLQLEKYQIDKSIEPFCVKENGAAQGNNIN